MNFIHKNVFILCYNQYVIKWKWALVNVSVKSLMDQVFFISAYHCIHTWWSFNTFWRWLMVLHVRRKIIAKISRSFMKLLHHSFCVLFSLEFYTNVTQQRLRGNIITTKWLTVNHMIPALPAYIMVFPTLQT